MTSVQGREGNSCLKAQTYQVSFLFWDVDEGSGVAERNAATEYMYYLLGYLWEIHCRQRVSSFFPIPFVRKCQSFPPYQHALHVLTVVLYSQSLLSLLVD